MSTQHLRWDGDYRFTATDSWGNDIAIDATEGSAQGAKPADLLPISLAACTAYDIINILSKQRQDLRALDTEITSTQQGEAPWTFTTIVVAYTARGDVDETKARKALELSEQKYCAVSATLRPSVELTFTISVEKL